MVQKTFYFNLKAIYLHFCPDFHDHMAKRFVEKAKNN